MKTQGLMLTALIISTGAFAQSTGTKQQHSLKMNSNTRTEANVSKQGASAGANTSTSTELKSASTVSGNKATSSHQVNKQSDVHVAAINDKEQEPVQEGPGALEGPAQLDEYLLDKKVAALSSEAEASLDAGITTGMQLKTAVENEVKTGVTQLKKSVTGTTSGMLKANTAITNSLKIKTAPIKVNTRIAGAAGIRVL